VRGLYVRRLYVRRLYVRRLYVRRGADVALRVEDRRPRSALVSAEWQWRVMFVQRPLCRKGRLRLRCHSWDVFTYLSLTCSACAEGSAAWRGAGGFALAGDG
jgi:hypothetical protein